MSNDYKTNRYDSATDTLTFTDAQAHGFQELKKYYQAGIFLLPMIAGREPPKQHWLAYALPVALAVVVFGSLIGEFITIHGGWRHIWQWFGGQGFEYLDLGRFWQTLLTVGLFFWVIIIFRVYAEGSGPSIWATCPGCFSFRRFRFPFSTG
jgi:nitric oxide reductase subunit B